MAGVGVIQPENRDCHIAENRDCLMTETDSEVMSSPSRSPMRMKGKGLLERYTYKLCAGIVLKRNSEIFEKFSYEPF